MEIEYRGPREYDLRPKILTERTLKTLHHNIRIRWTDKGNPCEWSGHDRYEGRDAAELLTHIHDTEGLTLQDLLAPERFLATPMSQTINRPRKVSGRERPFVSTI